VKFPPGRIGRKTRLSRSFAFPKSSPEMPLSHPPCHAPPGSLSAFHEAGDRSSQSIGDTCRTGKRLAASILDLASPTVPHGHASSTDKKVFLRRAGVPGQHQSYALHLGRKSRQQKPQPPTQTRALRVCQLAALI
jgi:hypothetical protein